MVEFFKVVSWICQSCPVYFSLFETKLKFDQDLKLLLWTNVVEWVKLLNALGPLCPWQCLLSLFSSSFFTWTWWPPELLVISPRVLTWWPSKQCINWKYRYTYFDRSSRTIWYIIWNLLDRPAYLLHFLQTLVNWHGIDTWCAITQLAQRKLEQSKHLRRSCF